MEKNFLKPRLLSSFLSSCITGIISKSRFISSLSQKVEYQILWGSLHFREKKFEKWPISYWVNEVILNYWIFLSQEHKPMNNWKSTCGCCYRLNTHFYNVNTQCEYTMWIHISTDVFSQLFAMLIILWKKCNK